MKDIDLKLASSKKDLNGQFLDNLKTATDKVKLTEQDLKLAATNEHKQQVQAMNNSVEQIVKANTYTLELVKQLKAKVQVDGKASATQLYMKIIQQKQMLEGLEKYLMETRLEEHVYVI